MANPMRLAAGELDRRITFERKTIDDSFDGAGSETWEAVFIGVPAQVRDVLPGRSEAVMNGLATTTNPARVRIRWREGITSDMRIIYGSRVLQIVSGPAELGRRGGLEMLAEEYTPAGNPA